MVEESIAPVLAAPVCACGGSISIVAISGWLPAGRSANSQGDRTRSIDEGLASDSLYGGPGGNDRAVAWPRGTKKDLESVAEMGDSERILHKPAGRAFLEISGRKAQRTKTAVYPIGHHRRR